MKGMKITISLFLSSLLGFSLYVSMCLYYSLSILSLFSSLSLWLAIHCVYIGAES